MSSRVGRQLVRSFCSRPSSRFRSRAWDEDESASTVASKRETLLEGIRRPTLIDSMWMGDVVGRAKLSQQEVLDGAEYAYAKVVKAFGHPDKLQAERALTNLLREGALGTELYNYLKETRSAVEQRISQRMLLRMAKSSAGKGDITSAAEVQTVPHASTGSASASNIFAQFEHRSPSFSSSPSSASSSSPSSSSPSPSSPSSSSPLSPSSSSPSPSSTSSSFSVATSSSSSSSSSSSAATSASISSVAAQPSELSSQSVTNLSPVLEVRDLQAQFVLFFIPGVRKVIEDMWEELAQLPAYEYPIVSLIMHPRATWRIVLDSATQMAQLDKEHFAFSVVVEIFATERYLGKEKRTSHLLRFDRAANETEFKLVDINGAVLGMHSLSHIPD